MSRSFYLVRHGETTANLAGVLDTAAPGAELTERGRSQAASLVDHFRGITIPSIHVSNLIRTHQTAAPLLADRGLEPVIHPGLRELSVGELEGRTDADAVATYRVAYQRWLDGHLTERLPGGESAADTIERTEAALATMDLREDPAVIVSHGSTIRLWAALRCVNVEPSIGARFIENTAVLKIVEGADGWHLESWDQRTDTLPDTTLAGASGTEDA